MSNFIYNSYCVVHPGAETISLTTAYQPAEVDPAPVKRTADFSLLWAMVGVLALLAAVSLNGEGSALLVGMLLWALALVGWGLSLPSVRRGLVLLRKGFHAWQVARREAAEDERTWNMALHDARLMADLARAMDRQER